MKIGRATAFVTCLAIAMSTQGMAAASTRNGRTQIMSRVFVIYDANLRQAVRKTYAVRMAPPRDGMTFEWRPDRPSANDPELASGHGRLIWRKAGAASYDEAAIFSVYEGLLRAGRPDGVGELRRQDGLHYVGDWHAGQYEGQGRLETPDGEAYVGAFKAGQFEGAGTLIHADGESFVGGFSNGRKDGKGKTRLPSGLTYESVWRKGAEDPSSLRIRLAQAGAAPTTGIARDVAITFRVDAKPTRYGEPSAAVLGYVAKNEPDKVSIMPDNKSLMAAWKGNGPINGVTGISTEESSQPPAQLRFRIKNNSSAPLQIQSGGLEVEESVADLQPVMLIGYGAENCPSSYFDPELNFYNLGWSDPTNFGVEYGFSKEPSTDPLNLAGIATQKFSTSIKKAKPSEEYNPNALEYPLDLTASLKSLGANVAQLKTWSDALPEFTSDGQTKPSDQGVKCGKKNDADCLKDIVSSGVFGSIGSLVKISDGEFTVRLTGRVTYTWKDARNAEQSYRAHFAANVHLGARRRNCSGAEGSSPDYDEASRPLLTAKLGQSNYKIPIPFARTIAPGKTEELPFQFGAPKSSTHKFRLVLQTKDGTVLTSRKADLLFVTLTNSSQEP